MVEHCVVLSNTKKRNLGPILRTSSAFDAKDVVIVGQDKFGTHGAHGANKHTKTRVFGTFSEAAQDLHALGFQICGVEYAEGAMPVQSRPFSGNTAFIIPNESDYLSEEQKQACDFFVYVDEYLRPPPKELSGGEDAQSEMKGQDSVENADDDGDNEDVNEDANDGEGNGDGDDNNDDEEEEDQEDDGVETILDPSVPVLLDVNVLTAIVLHHFCAWARYEERPFTGRKFVLDTITFSKTERSEAEMAVRAEREVLRQHDVFAAGSDERPNGGDDQDDEGGGLFGSMF